MTKPHKEHSPCSNLYGNNIFLYDVFLHFYTQFLSGWWTVLRELTKKSVFYSFGNHPLTDSTNSVKQWWRDICNWFHVLILATTSWVIHSRAFLFVLYIFWWACMINCRSLLYWGVRSSLVLPQTPWSSFPDLMSYFFSFYCKTLFFFVYSKSLPHMRCSSTNSLPPPSPLYLLHAVVC